MRKAIIAAAASALIGAAPASQTSPGKCWIDRGDNVRSTTREGWQVQACIFVKYDHGRLTEQAGFSLIGIQPPPETVPRQPVPIHHIFHYPQRNRTIAP
jgi:hypothetical protein